VIDASPEPPSGLARGRWAAEACGLPGHLSMKKSSVPFPAIVAAVALAACSGAPHACSDRSEVTTVVEEFGRRLHLVSLQSPAAEEDIRAQYSQFVSPALLDEWVLALPAAPGRMVSSPWPDSIEVTAIEEVTPGRFSVSGNILEMTSWEVTHGGIAGQIPVTMTVEGVEGLCLITRYEEVPSG
jgi:hypothetical protein